jgi:hypothetical protein
MHNEVGFGAAQQIQRAVLNSRVWRKRASTMNAKRAASRHRGAWHGGADPLGRESYGQPGGTVSLGIRQPSLGTPICRFNPAHPVKRPSLKLKTSAASEAVGETTRRRAIGGATGTPSRPCGSIPFASPIALRANRLCDAAVPTMRWTVMTNSGAGEQDGATVSCITPRRSFYATFRSRSPFAPS